MEKIKIFVLLVFLSTGISGQVANAETPEIIRPGLICARLTLSPSYNFSDKSSYFYLHGNMEGYFNNKISAAGEGYFYLGNASSFNNSFDFNHSLFFGFSRHFTKNNNDFYIGLQPGLSFTKVNADEIQLYNTCIGVNPLFSSVVGYNFFVHKFFHFFIQTRVIAGEHNYDRHKSLVEFRLSAGLGFNFNTIVQ